MATKRLFISYSHADKALLESLRTHLKPIERRGIIAPWFDGYLLPGDNIDERVREALDQAEIIALLVSPDFLASDYCFDIEMKSAVGRHQDSTARVIPIIARACQWQKAPFGRLVAVPTDGRPIMSAAWSDKDEAWTIVATAIEQAASQNLAGKSASSTLVPTPEVTTPYGGMKARAMGITAPKRFTDKDKDEFKHAAFDEIAASFEVSLQQLSGDMSGSFRRIDANRFTATIYRSGKKMAGCTIWIGGGSFGANAICYVANDSAETSGMNDWLSIEAEEGSLVLRTNMSSIGDRDKKGLDASSATDHLWSKFTERLSWG